MLGTVGMHLRTEAADPAGGDVEPLAHSPGESVVASPVELIQTSRTQRTAAGRSEPHGDTPEAAA